MDLDEVPANQVAWRRSSFCANSECAEVTQQDGLILLRSSVTPQVVIRFTPEEFRALRLGIQAGEYDGL